MSYAVPDPLFPLPDQRQQHILGQLARDGRVLAIDLARQLGLSEDTIRRDLRELAAAGLCRRVYGGALPRSPASGTLVEREGEQSARKAALGRAAATLVETLMQRGGVLFLDAGSTNMAIARALPPGLGISIVTNAPPIAAALATIDDTELVMIGGRIDRRLGAALGARALRDIEDIRFDVAIIGACAIDLAVGLAAFDFEDAGFKRVAARSASIVIAAVTNEKLNTTAPFGIIPMARLTHLVIEADAPEKVASALISLGVQVHRAVSPDKNSRSISPQ